MPDSRSRRGALGGALLALLLSGAPALAESPQKVSPNRLTPAQQQKLFPEWRRLNLEATQARIAILEKHQRCLSAAGTPQALQKCQKDQRAALMTQRQQQRNAMKQLFERNGIPMPRGMAAPGTAL